MSNQVNSQWQAGDVLLERYKIAAILGQDALGEIYKATHLNWKTPLTIRSLKSGIVTTLGGFEALQSEVSAWINLDLNPHVLQCYYLGQIGGLSQLFTEYSPGHRLHHWIHSRELYTGSASLRRILDIAIQLVWGLQSVHAQGISHQNLSPDMVHVTPQMVAKIGDFGLTPAYQVAIGKTTCPTVNDIQGWGLTVLEMFVGNRIDRASATPQTSAATQALSAYLKTGSPDPRIPTLPEPLVELLQACFAEPATLDLAQIAQRLQVIYQTVTSFPYARQAPTATPLADRLNNQALCCWDLGRSDAAFALWDQALSAQPHHSQSTYNRGLLNWRSGKIDDRTLLQHLEACKTTEYPIVDYLIGMVHLERGDYQAASIRLSRLQNLPEDLAANLEACRTLARSETSSRQWLRHLQDRSLEPLRAIALSLDGRYALSGGADRQLKLWQVETGQCLYTFRGHEADVTALAFSPDGLYVVSGSADKTLKLWNIISANLVHTFDGLHARHLTYQGSVNRFLEGLSIKAKKLVGSPGSGRSSGHQGTILAVDFSADRRYLLSGSADKTVKLWDVETGKCLQTLKGHKEPVFAVQFSRDRQHCLSASQDQTVNVWNLTLGKTVRTLQGFQDLSAAVFCPNGRLILTVGSVMQLWDVATGKVVKTLAGHNSTVTTAAFMGPDLIVSGGADRLLKLWEVETGRCLRTFEGHELEIQALCASQDSSHVLSADTNQLNLWMVKGGDATPQAALQLVRSYSVENLSNQEQQVQQSLMLAQFAIQQGQFENAVRLLRQVRSQPGFESPEADQAWLDLYAYLPRQSLNQVKEQVVLQRHVSTVNAVAMHGDGRALTGSADQTVKLWDGATGRCLLSFEGHQGAVKAVLFHPEGTFAVSASADRSLKIWDIQSGECIGTLEGHTDAVNAIAFSPDGRWLLSGSEDRTCKLWDLSTRSCLRTFEAQPAAMTAVAFSPDGQTFVTGLADRSLKLWDLAEGHGFQTLAGHTGAVSAVAWSVDGRHLLSGSLDKTLKLWNRNGSCVRTLEGHQAAVRSIAISGDGNYALSGSDDQTLKIWDLNNGECLRTLTGHLGSVRAVTWSPEGRYLLSGSEDHTSKRWVLDWELTEQAPAAWDEGARPYLETFLSLQAAKTAEQSDLLNAGSAAGKPRPTWTEADFQRLMRTLQQAGYGWLQTEGVRQQLVRMAQASTAPAVLKQPEVTVFPTAFAQEFTTMFGDTASSASVTLYVKSGSLTGQEFVFREPTTCIIGRAKDCQLQLPNDEQHNMVSRYHCSLEINPPSIRIRDLGSLHGTYVNGQMIGRRPLSSSQATPENLPDYALTTGDEIQVGQTVLHVMVQVAESDVPPKPFDTAGLIDQTVFPAQDRQGNSADPPNRS